MRRILVIICGRILNAISALVAVRLYTEVLKPEEVGRLSLFLALTSLFGLILIGPVNSYLLRRAIEWNAEGTLIQRLRGPLVYSCVSSALVVLVSIGLIRIGLLSASIAAAPLIGLAILGAGVGTFAVTLFNYLNQPSRYVVLSCAESWGGVALAGLLCLRVSATAEGWLSGITAGQLLIGLISIILIRRMRQEQKLPIANRALATGFDLRAIGLYSAPLLVATGLSWVQTSGYRYLFVHVVDERTLGLFTTALAVGISPMLLLEQLLGDTYLPILTRALAMGQRDQWPTNWDTYARASILPLVLFTMLACSGTSFFAKILVSHTYYAVAWVGAFGAVAKCLQMMSSMYVGFSYAALETSHLMFPYFIGAASLIGCTFVFAHLPAFVGFGLSLICGAAGLLLPMAWAGRRRYKLRFPYAAFLRAVALGLPMVGVNLTAEHIFPIPTAPGAIMVLAADTLYMAAICWILHPSDAGSNVRPSLTSVSALDKVALP